LSKNEVRVWLADLTGFAGHLSTCRSLLSPEECARAARFAFECDERRFVLSHGLVRKLLSQYLGLHPARISFQYNDQGKPAVQADADFLDDLRFSIAHSADCLVCAVSLGREVGVDVEVVRSDVDHLQLAQRFFSTREYEDIAGCPDNGQRDRFFQYWTCKEAYLKARGIGLSAGLAQIEVLLDRTGRIVSVLTEPQATHDPRLKIHSFHVSAGIAAAVAAAGESWEMKVSTLPADLLN
jgi:4'-phosphopantetheinyl transferase